MVRIINGEIVQDDDPRLQQQKAPRQPETLQHRSTAANARGPVQAAAQPQNGPPPPFFRTGQDPGAMSPPYVEISGVKITATAAMAMMAAYSMFGMRGLIGGGIVYFVYMKSQRDQAAAGGQQGQGQQRGPPGAQQAAGGGYQYVPAAQPPSQAAPAGGTGATGGSSAFQGRGHRLGST